MYKYLIITALIAFLGLSCNNQNTVKTHDNEHIVGLATPLKLRPDTTTMVIRDYFTQPELVDSFTTNSGLKLNRVHADTLVITGQTPNTKAITSLHCWIDGKAYAIPIKKSPAQKVVFTFDAKADAKTVQLAGEMNGWNPLASDFVLNDNIWEYEMYLDPGKYAYQIVVDGTWQLDPQNPEKVSNGQGAYNSVLQVGEFSQIPLHIFGDKLYDNKLVVESNKDFEQCFVFWENYLLDNNLVTLNGRNIDIEIPEVAGKMQRSHLRVFAFAGDELSNDMLVPLNKGIPITTPELLTRNDKHSMIIYNAMVDRFNNGTKENDHPLNLPTVHPRADYHGGDILGIEQKISDGYFDTLGINTLWISPIVQNPLEPYGLYKEPETQFSGYHGYWPVSLTKIDFRFGTDQEFRSMINTAHSKNMNVLLDIVANHVHEENPVYKQHPDWATELYLPDGTLNTERWDEYRLTTWFDVFLPTLDLENPVVTEAMSDSALFWLENYPLDGFRHDATKHIPEIFWRALTYKIKKNVIIPENRSIYQIGETYGSPGLISSYVHSGLLDAQFDFNVYDAAVNAFADKSSDFSNLKFRLEQSLDYYGAHNLMGNITGNQDRARFISYADGSVTFSEDTKYAGWNRKITNQGDKGFAEMEQIFAFVMTIPGVPVVFYGDEIGFPGGNDPDNRKMMKFDNLDENQLNLRQQVAKLTRIRRSNMALMYGDFLTLQADNKVFAFSRRYFGQEAIVVFNKSEQEQSINLTIEDTSGAYKSHFGNKFEIKENVLNLSIAPGSYEILTLN